MNTQQLRTLLESILTGKSESEWVEFKHNFHSIQEIGERISALANGAAIRGQDFGFLVFGVEDESCSIVGTNFRAKSHKKGEEDIEHWLVNRLSPKIDLEVYEFDFDDDRHISLFKIPAAKGTPVKFLNVSYIRINSITRRLHDFPDKEAKIWQSSRIPFERELAMENLSAADVIRLLDTGAFFDLIKQPYPTSQAAVIEKLLDEGLVARGASLSITKLGALLFAKKLNDFEHLGRKSIRVVVYKGKNKIETEREQITSKGYALEFESIVVWINSQLPANEEIGKALRKDARMYPEIAIRELVANAIIHQDLRELGFPMIEIFTDRLEVSNPGIPLVDTDRFIDAYISRNEKLADIMRRMGFCEEKGSGMDKVFFLNELFQLPPVNFELSVGRTKVTLYCYRRLSDLDRNEKIRACYQHACLKYVSNEKMTNQTLRERFLIEDQNAAIASRIIKESVNGGVIKEDNPESKSRKYACYVPFWA